MSLHFSTCSRRHFLQTMAAGTAALSTPLAVAQSRHTIAGEVRVNGRRADAGTPIRAGDTVITGRDASIAFAVGQDAFLLRQNSVLKLEQDPRIEAIVGGLRMLTGALVGVFGRTATPRTVQTATVTAGIRGTAIYVEAADDSTYFCTCYGTVELTALAGRTRQLFITADHSPVMVQNMPGANAMIEKASPKNHENSDLARLEGMVGRRSPLGG